MDHSGPTSDSLGTLISRHGRTRAHMLGPVLAAVLLILSIALPMLSLGNPHFDPDAKPLVVKASVFLVVMGLGLLALWKFTVPRDILSLHERGVVRHGPPDKVRPVAFADMSDVYLFRTGQYVGGMINALAFRRSPDDAWVAVLDNVRAAPELRQAIINGYLEARVPASLQAIADGQTVRFHVIDDGDRRVRRVTGGFFKVKARPLDLSAKGIDVDGRHIPLDAIHDIAGADTAGTIGLLDEHGKALYTVHYLSLFSADLFTIVLGQLLERRRPAHEALRAH
jgi:hypothetical protein